MTFETTAMAPSEKPKLFRKDLTEHFRAHGLPPLSLPYINKISALCEGPPVAMVWNGRHLYDPDEALEWLRAKVEKQTEAARERARHNREIKQRTLELNKEVRQQHLERRQSPAAA
jgi:hypothetical protein